MSEHCFRFFGTQQSESVWCVEGDEAHHGLKVLRIKIGDQVEVCDGNGRVIVGAVDQQEQKSFSVAVTSKLIVSPPSQSLSLLMGALDHGHIDELLPALVEVGVDHLFVYLPEKADKSRIGAKQLARWSRVVDTAVKQSKRAYRMSISLLDSIQGAEPLCSEADVVVDCSLDREAISPLISVTWNGLKSMLVHVSHEAGASPAEQSLLREFAGQKYLPVSLGPQILRARTAVVVAASIASLRRLT